MIDMCGEGTIDVVISNMLEYQVNRSPRTHIPLPPSPGRFYFQKPAPVSSHKVSASRIRSGHL